MFFHFLAPVNKVIIYSDIRIFFLNLQSFNRLQEFHQRSPYEIVLLPADDCGRDAFFGGYETGTVRGDIDLTGSPISLQRPFAQVNVLVPAENFVDESAPVTSSMSVAVGQSANEPLELTYGSIRQAPDYR